MPTAQEIRDQQRQNWNDFAPGWKKWDALTMRFLAPFGQAMLELIPKRDDLVIVDLAAGTGEPGLTAAARVPKGRVTSTDLSEVMSRTAAENAASRGLSNFEAKVASADSLPMPDASVDVVLCRFGFMFFPDPSLVAREIARVLRPGGMLAAAVWSTPDHNLWATAIMAEVGKRVDLPKPPPDAPALFRYADPKPITDALAASGLVGVTSTEVASEARYPDIETYWTVMNEVAAPVVAGMAKADTATRTAVHEAVVQALQPRVRDGELFLPGAAHILSARKA